MSSGEGRDGGGDRVQSFPVTVHHGVVELLATLHKIVVPLVHVTFRDWLWRRRDGIIRRVMTKPITLTSIYSVTHDKSISVYPENTEVERQWDPTAHVEGRRVWTSFQRCTSSGPRSF